MKSHWIFAAGFLLGAGITFLVLQIAAPKPNVEAPTPPQIVNVEKECPVCASSFSNEILPPPEFSKDLANPLVTNREGEVRIGWEKVKGAKGYRVYILNSKGKTVTKFKSSNVALYLKEIPVPEGAREVKYQMRMTSINGLDVEGERGEARELTVKAMGSLVAPKVREIRIED